MNKLCVWDQEDEDSTTYHTDCGWSFIFNDDGPKENGMKYCCYCGCKLIENDYVYE